MNRMSFFLLSIGLVLLLLSVSFSSPTDANPVLQVTITPTAFAYLPFVAKNWPTPAPTPTVTTTPTPTYTPTPTTVWPGFWTGNYDSSFTVTSDSTIRNLTFTLPVPPPRSGTCRMTVLEDIPINDGTVDYGIYGAFRFIEGRFTTSTTLAANIFSVSCGPWIAFYGTPLEWTASWQHESSVESRRGLTAGDVAEPR